MENHHCLWVNEHYFDWAIFNGYVNLPEGIPQQDLETHESTHESFQENTTLKLAKPMAKKRPLGDG